MIKWIRTSRLSIKNFLSWWGDGDRLDPSVSTYTAFSSYPSQPSGPSTCAFCVQRSSMFHQLIYLSIRLRVVSGRGTTRAEDAQQTPTKSDMSPSILANEDHKNPCQPIGPSTCAFRVQTSSMDRLLGGLPREQKMLKGHLPRVRGTYPKSSITD